MIEIYERSLCQSYASAYRAGIKIGEAETREDALKQVEAMTELWLNVTYNYARHYYCLGERGIREIYGKTGAESIPMLKAAALRLGDDVSDDYWEATEGNAKRALLQLLAMARMRPDGVWDGD